MTTIQTGCIQTILENGRFLHYRATFWVPKEYADLIGYQDIVVHGKKFMYCPVSKSWEEIWHKITAAQVIVTDMKITALQRKKVMKLEQLSKYQPIE